MELPSKAKTTTVHFQEEVKEEEPVEKQNSITDTQKLMALIIDLQHQESLEGDRNKVILNIFSELPSRCNLRNSFRRKSSQAPTVRSSSLISQRPHSMRLLMFQQLSFQSAKMHLTLNRERKS
jgi:hypothetical protein